MKTVLREEQCLVCKGTGQRSWLYRHWDDVGMVITCYILYVEFWDTLSKGWKVGTVILGFLAASSFIYEGIKNKRGKCNNCKGTGKIVLEEMIEGK